LPKAQPIKQAQKNQASGYGVFSLWQIYPNELCGIHPLPKLFGRPAALYVLWRQCIGSQGDGSRKKFLSEYEHASAEST
jgi:hypothetical protein